MLFSGVNRVPDLQEQRPDDMLWFMSATRDRVTISAYKDDGVKNRVGAWVKTIPALP
jgi:hypothetical protein